MSQNLPAPPSQATSVQGTEQAASPLSIFRLKGERALIVTAVATLLSYASTFFNFGRRALEALQGFDYLAAHNTKSVEALYWLFSPRGAQLLTLLFLAAFFVAVIRTFRSFQHVQQTAGHVVTPHVEAAPVAKQIVSTERVPAAPEPNLICTNTDPRPAHIEYGFLLEGLNEYREHENAVVIAAEITNEFLPSTKVADVKGVSAEIIYQSLDGLTTKVRRGSWLNHSAYQLDFDVHDSYWLIIAFVSSNEKHDEYAFIFTREMSNQRDDFVNRLALLEGDDYNVKVRLINEDEGIVHKEFDFSLTITREPGLDVELSEVKELTPKEIRQQLEVFLAEGSGLLREFPRDKQATSEDIAKVDDWEKRAVKFLGRYPDLFSTTLFLSDYPEVLVAGGAQGGNWPSLKKLARRLATLRDFIDELRRG